MKTENKRSNNSFVNTLSSDFFKLGRMKSVYIGAGIMFFIVLVVFAILFLISRDDQESFSAFMTMVFGTGNFSFAFTSISYLDLFIMIIIGIFVGKDFSNGTMRLAVAKGADRLQMYFSKLIVLTTLALGYMAGLIVVCGILSPAFKADEAFTALTFARLMRTFALSFVTILSFISVYLMFGFLTRSPGAALGASFGVYAVNQFVELIPVIGALANKEIDLAYFPLQQLPFCISDQAMEVGEAMKLLFMPLAYTLLSSFVGIFTFLKRDIK